MSSEQDKLKVSLEPPKLFGRKKKSDKHGAEDAGPGPETEGASTPPVAPEDEPTADNSEPEPAPEPTRDPDPTPEPARDPDPEPVAESSPDDPAPEPTPASQFAPEAERTRDPSPEPEPEPEPAAAAEETTPPPDPAPEAPAADTTPTPEPLPDFEPAPEPAVTRTPEPGPSLTERMGDKIRSRFGKLDSDEISISAEEEDAEISSGVYTAPMLGNYPAAVLTGAIVGLALVVLTWLSQQGCDAITGTPNCGSSVSFVLLIAIFVVCVMLGSAILKNFQVPDPGSTSFLAVGLVAVIALLLLIEALSHWSMLIVIPVIGAASFALSVYITKTFVEPTDDS